MFIVKGANHGAIMTDLVIVHVTSKGKCYWHCPQDNLN